MTQALHNTVTGQYFYKNYTQAEATPLFETADSVIAHLTIPGDAVITGLSMYMASIDDGANLVIQVGIPEIDTIGEDGFSADAGDPSSPGGWVFDLSNWGGSFPLGVYGFGHGLSEATIEASVKTPAAAGEGDAGIVSMTCHYFRDITELIL